MSSYPICPNFIVTTSIDGYTRLTDIRRPHTDTVTAPRSRVASPPLAFSSQVLCFLAPEDAELVRALPLRRFFSVSSLGRSPGQIMALATSPVHASLLIGSSDGSAIIMNALRRMSKPKGYLQYQQTWFKHEWVPNDQSDVIDDSSPRPEIRPGKSRITEDYKLKTYDLTRHAKVQDTNFDGPVETKAEPKPKTTKKAKTGNAEPKKNAKSVTNEASTGIEGRENPEPGADGNIVNGAISGRDQGQQEDAGTPDNGGDDGEEDPKQSYLHYHTIFEEEAAVTCAAWCPAVECGGWAAVGMGSGLVRVEDIAI